MASNKKDLFVAIDGNAIVHRAFHAYPQNLTTSDGLAVNAVYGFTVMLLAALKQFDPKYVFCSFDTKAPTFRHAKFADYKGTRKPTDEGLLAQFPIVEQVLNAFNIPVIKKPGFEADDILGTVAQWRKNGKWKDEQFEMYILTGDRDLLQLVGDDVTVCMPVGSFSNLGIYDEHKTLEKYGYLPSQVIDHKALVGDPSDNIPGVKGIGEKTAITLLSKYGTLDNICKNLTEIGGRSAKLIGEGIEQAEFSKDLATISTDLDLELDLKGCVARDFDENSLITIFKKLEFKSLISKIPKSDNHIEQGGAVGQFGLFGAPVLEKEVEIDWESLKNRVKMVVYGYISKEESSNGIEWLFQVVVDNSGEVFCGKVSSFTKYEECETWYYNIEEMVSRNYIAYGNGLDIRFLAYNLSSGKKNYTLSSLAFDHTLHTLPEKISTFDLQNVGNVLLEIVSELIKKMVSMKHGEYVTEKISVLKGKIKKKDVNSFEMVVKDIEIPVARILARMEERGIALDLKYLKKLDTEIDGEIAKESKKVWEEVGHEFNINSPKQLSDVLFNELQLPASGKDKSTREEVLHSLINMHGCIPHILHFRELSKLSGTYVKPLIEINRSEVHTDFKQMGTTSGRFSSINPNMQNIPAKGDWASKIRAMFVARPGFKLVGADYSQMEFRIMADISKDPALLSDFANKKDIHLATASRVLNKDIKEVTQKERYLAKTINFAILFGQSKYGLSKLANIPVELATQYIDEYFRDYSCVAKYIKNATRDAIDVGYVQSMFGRTRYVAGLTSRNRNIVNAAIREAVNMPIQGGEADIMKLAMIDIQKKIDEKYREKAYILLQIHDELNFEAKSEIVEDFAKDIEKIMTNVFPLSVPLGVHVSIGNNMSELK
ncbi:DNA polymerase I [Candidatus Dojkabacteria bacterium]|jgi:DNA polymerase-1|nr:DNA polymerase I [Candidatus Dojkabacteria bacterium]